MEEFRKNFAPRRLSSPVISSVLRQVVRVEFKQPRVCSALGQDLLADAADVATRDERKAGEDL